MIQATVERMYTETEENRFLEVTYANGDKEVLYFKDFNSGAMIQNIVDRAKKMAIKDFLEHDQRGLRVQHMLQACVDEFKENEDLPNTTNPDDWARISGKKGERIVFIRTLITGKQGTEPAGRSTPSPTPASTSDRGGPPGRSGSLGPLAGGPTPWTMTRHRRDAGDTPTERSGRDPAARLTQGRARSSSGTGRASWRVAAGSNARPKAPRPGPPPPVATAWRTGRGDLAGQLARRGSTCPASGAEPERCAPGPGLTRRLGP